MEHLQQVTVHTALFHDLETDMGIMMFQMKTIPFLAHVYTVTPV